MIKGAIFDFDGTLFDSMFVWDDAAKNYLALYGFEAESGIEKILQPMSLSESADYLKERYNFKLSADEIIAGIESVVEDFYLNSVQPKKGAGEFLEALRAMGVKACIATATQRRLVEAALKRCSLYDCFSDILSCTELNTNKTESLIFNRALETLGTKKSDTVVFEDALHAAAAAKKGGFILAAVYDEHEKKQRELRALAEIYIESFDKTTEFWKFVSAI